MNSPINSSILIVLALCISQLVLAQRFDLDDEHLLLEALEINSRHHEIGPAFIDGHFYFSSDVPTRENDREGAFFQLYHIPLHLIGQDEAAEVVLPGNKGFHTGPVSYCKRTGELFVTVSDVNHPGFKNDSSEVETYTLGIAIYRKVAGRWIFASMFPHTVKGFSDGHPAISVGGDTLVFASDRPGGMGKTDLYMSVRKTGIWYQPHNLGEMINTRKNELTPYFDQGGRLYFASDGHRGRGKLDIFYSEIEDGKFRIVRNPGKPFNSSKDDFGLVLHPYQPMGFFVSERKKRKQKDDIYCFRERTYQPRIQQADSMLRLLEEQAAAIRERLNSSLDDLNKKQAVCGNVVCHFDYVLVDSTELPDLRLEFYYQLSNDTLELGENAYRLREYAIESARAVQLLVKVVERSIKEELSAYFTPHKSLIIKINGAEDAFPFSEPVTYDGEFGDLLLSEYYYNNEKQTVNLYRMQELDQQSLAFLRAHSVGKRLLNDVKELNATNNKMVYKVIPASQLNKKHHWGAIEIIIENVFGNF